MNNTFTVYTIDNAPKESKPLLENAQSAFGMVPNFHAVLAEAPAALEAYMKLHELVTQTSLTPIEQHVVWMTINTENECHYCTPAHVMLAVMSEVDESIITAIRNKKKIDDEKLEALRVFTTLIVEKRGLVSEQELKAFYDAGYSKQNALEVILVLSQKTLSNYSNHITHVPVDEAFQPYV